MKSLDGVLHRALLLKILLLLIILFIPILLSGIAISQPISTKDASFIKSSYKFSFIAGDFQHFDVILTEEVEQICIIAYHGDSIPDVEKRTESNYYKWEYKNGEWKDNSGYSSKYLDPTKCYQKDTTYSFYIGLNNKAKPGKWNIRIFINNKEEVKSNCNIVVVAPFQIFLSSLMGVYQPFNKDKKSINEINIICSDRKKIISESETNNIDNIVDGILKKHSTSKNEKDTQKILDLPNFKNKSLDEKEVIRTTFHSYQKSKLKTYEKNSASQLFFNKRGGGRNYLSQFNGINYNRCLSIVLIIFLLTVSAVPIIAPEETSSLSSLNINFFKIFPEKINLSESIFVEVSVSDPVGIKSLDADINNEIPLNMLLIEGNIENNTIYSGLWQGIWIAQDVIPGEFIVTIKAINNNDETISQHNIFTVLFVIEENNPKNESKDGEKPEINSTIDLNQTEEQNNSLPNKNITVPGEELNNTVDQNNTNSTNNYNISGSNNDENEYSNVFPEKNTLLTNQTEYNNENESDVFIADKRHDAVSTLPGSRFYVERTIDGVNGTNVVFAPMFSDSLSLESIEILDNTSENKDKNNVIIKKENINIFNSGVANNPKEKKIEKFKENLPNEIKKLNKVAYIDNIELHSPRTVRLWFRAPTWEQLQSGTNPSGEISYLVFSEDDNDSFDFEGSTWWDSDWGYRKLITINASQIITDLVNFPILVNITDSNLASKAQGGGNDIAFVLWSDNSTKLNHEIEAFNGVTGSLTSWVNVTYLSKTQDTKIWMYYGNSICSNQQNPSGTWDSNYISVWHFNESGTGTRYDSKNNNNATPSGYDGDEATTGIVAGADNLDGTNDCLDAGSSTTLDITSQISIEACVKINALSVDQKIGGRQDGSAGGYKMGIHTNDKVEFEIRDSANNPYLNRNEPGGTTLQTGVYYYLVGVYSDAGDYINTYVNYSLDRPYTTVGVLGSTTGSFWISKEPFQNNFYLSGTIDEFRLSNIVRNISWISTTYATIFNQSQFLYLGSEEILTPNVSNPYPNDGATNIQIPPNFFNITISDPRGENMNITWRTNASGSWQTFNVTDSGGTGVGNGTYSATNTSWVSLQSTRFWWSVNVSNDNTWINETYNFTTSYPPQISNPTPANNSITVITPICSVTVSDPDGGTVTVRFYENTTGSWVLQQTYYNVDVTSPIISSWDNFNNASIYDTSYWWMVNVSDEKGCFNEEIYKFTTTNDNPPVLSFENPLDETTGIKTSLSQINVTISDIDGDTMDWSIQTSPNIGSDSGSGASNGSISCSVSGLIAGVTYTWYVNVTDGTIWTNATYSYNTSIAPIITLITPSPNGTSAGGTLPWCSIWANDSDGDILNVTWATNASGSWVNVYTNTSVSANSTVSYQFTEFTDYSTNYYWLVFVNDSSSNMSSWYFFNSGMISTYVNTISPYTITKSPKVITASGSSNLDNVTLFYYYSSDNSTWWNSSFVYKKNITITGQAGAGTNYQVLLKIGETSGASGENFDLGGNSSNFPSGKNIGGDLRFIDDDDTTLLDFWVESVSGSTPNRLANIWVEVKDDLSSNVNIYCYYGNPQATNVSNGSNTFIVFDDFEGASLDNDIWTAYSVDSMSFSGSIMTTTCTNDDPTAIIADVNGAGPTGNNIAIRSYFRATAGTHTDQRMGVKIKCSLSNGQGYTYVLHDFSNTDEIRFLDDMVAWGAVQENDFTMNVWYTFEISHDGTNIRARRDDGVWRTWIRSGRSGYPALNPGGYSNSATGQWDWAVIRKCIATEPAYNSATEEIWTKWNNPSNPDTSAPWSWSFDFPERDGYYQFYSIANKSGYTNETAPIVADATCYFKLSVNFPVINSYDLRNSTGSKLNNDTGLLDVNYEYFFTINLTDPDGWADIEFLNLTAWFDQGSDTTFYNQTSGGNLNMFLQYENTTGTANYNLLWPNDEVELILIDCSETIIDENTGVINISFKLNSQIRWASSNDSWDSTQNITNDLYSWNFNISAIDSINAEDWIIDEYGVYKYTSISPAQDWVDVYTLPGFSDTTNIVAITFSSNYDFNITIYFEENLINISRGTTIPIAGNVVILSGTDPNDDITTDVTFNGIAEANAVDIFNNSGIFSVNGISQTVNVQFSVFVPLATLGGKYTARVATKIIQD